MYIFSQDRTQIINLHNLFDISIYGNYIRVGTRADDYRIAEYDSPEMAKHVMEYIATAIVSGKHMYVMPGKAGDVVDDEL